MIKITLSNGDVREFGAPLTAHAVMAQLDSKLANRVIVARFNGKLVDLASVIIQDGSLEFLTAQDPEGLQVLRHSAAHLMAQAVTELFPGTQVAVGPAIEDGFYHDFHCPVSIGEGDLARIEQRMQELAAADYPIVRTTMSRQAAIDYYTQRGEEYKVKMVESIPDDEVSFYSQGDFTNVCLGPHVPSTGYLKAFKLLKLAGAYWQGDASQEMLQRIYGTAWGSEAELQDYLARLEKAKLNDHRLVGKRLDLFHLQEEAPGMIFWHPKGWTLFTLIKNYLSAKLAEFGYQEVNTPQILDRSLWEKSGHWDKYREVMFITSSEDRSYAVKPMSCPGHIQIFKQGVKSYRDLPIRMAEFGCCHRNEISGSLHGIMRIRGFTQDDAHIFCTEDQIKDEAAACIRQMLGIYADFGFSEILVRLATRPEQRIGSDEIWDKAESALTAVLDHAQLAWQLAPGDGAFYGPKIEFSLRDSMGRIWQCGTIQVDFSMPERLGARYVDESGEKLVPVMLHRAMLGSIERFIGILLEETGGDLPLWLAPVQAVVANITDAQQGYAESVVARLRSLGYRVVGDLRNEKIGFKIREHTLAKVPLLLVVGDREMAAGQVAVRNTRGENLGQFSVEKLVAEVMIVDAKFRR